MFIEYAPEKWVNIDAIDEFWTQPGGTVWIRTRLGNVLISTLSIECFKDIFRGKMINRASDLK